jgi:hypothetical protein
MATFRKVHTSFWGDSLVQSMSPEQKYFFLYLLTNERTRQCGIYEISKKQIAYDTGYNTDTVSILLKYFMDTNKIRYSEATSEIAIRNWNKYNGNPSPKVQSLVRQELANVKDRSLILYLYSTDTVSIPNPQREGEEEREEEVEKEKNAPPAQAQEEANPKNLSTSPKSGAVPTEDEKKSIPQPPSASYDAWSYGT